LGAALRYPNEVRDTDSYFEEVRGTKVIGKLFKLAEHILDSKAADSEPEKFEDRDETALVEMLRRKQAHMRKQSANRLSSPRNGPTDLMTALKASILQQILTRQLLTGLL